jgi:hypothetical protein
MRPALGRAEDYLDCCLGPDEGGDPVPHARQEGQASSVVRPCGRQYQKSPLRRCFKPRPPWRAGCAGSPPAADRMSKESEITFLRRLSGLLSGCPPIDTRPQARAKLGSHEISDVVMSRKQTRQQSRQQFGLGGGKASCLSSRPTLRINKRARARPWVGIRCARTPQPRLVNGSIRRALRMNAIMTAIPQIKKMPCMMCTP